MGNDNTAAKVEKLANQVIEQAILVSNLCDQFKHAETFSHHMELAKDVAANIHKLSSYQKFDELIQQLYNQEA